MLGQPEPLGEHRRGAARDDVGVRVRRDERAAAADQPGDHGALVAVFGDAGDAAQQQRVVHEQQLRTRGDRLVDGVEHGIDGEVDAIDRCRRIARQQARVHPTPRPRRAARAPRWRRLRRRGSRSRLQSRRGLGGRGRGRTRAGAGLARIEPVWRGIAPVMRGIGPVCSSLSESRSCRRIAGIAVASGTTMPSTSATSTPMSLVASGDPRPLRATGTGSPARSGRGRSPGEAEPIAGEQQEPEEVGDAHLRVDAAGREQRRRVEPPGADHHLGREDARPGGDRHGERRREVAGDREGVGRRARPAPAARAATSTAAITVVTLRRALTPTACSAKPPE